MTGSGGGWRQRRLDGNLVKMAMILYQRDDCHLCDAAVEVLAAVRAGDFRSVFIDGDAVLEARYGRRVPVLVAADGRELGWPFDAGVLQRWLAGA